MSQSVNALCQNIESLDIADFKKSYIIPKRKMAQILNENSDHYFSSQHVDLVYDKFIWPLMKQAKQIVRRYLMKTHSTNLSLNPSNLFPKNIYYVRNPSILGINEASRVIHKILSPFRVIIKFPARDLIKVAYILEGRLIKIAQLLDSPDITNTILTHQKEIMSILG